MSRADRVGELLRREISEVLRRKLSDPRLGFTSITRVDMTDDLRNARVYISVLGTDEEKSDTLSCLTGAKRFILGLIAPHLEMKFLPELTFKIDSSIEKASRVFEIMHKLEKEKTPRTEKIRKRK